MLPKKYFGRSGGGSCYNLAQSCFLKNALLATKNGLRWEGTRRGVAFPPSPPFPSPALLYFWSRVITKSERCGPFNPSAYGKKSQSESNNLFPLDQHTALLLFEASFARCMPLSRVKLNTIFGSSTTTTPWVFFSHKNAGNQIFLSSDSALRRMPPARKKSSEVPVAAEQPVSQDPCPTTVALEVHIQKTTEMADRAAAVLTTMFRSVIEGPLVYLCPREDVDPTADPRARTWEWPRIYHEGESMPIMAACIDPTALPPRVLVVHAISFASDESMSVYRDVGSDERLLGILEGAEGILQGNQESKLADGEGFHSIALERLLSPGGGGGGSACGGGVPPSQSAPQSAPPGWKMVSNGSRASTVADICAANGLPYVHGCGCYELSAKSEKVSADKLLVARNKSTGEILAGTVEVRKRLGLPLGEAKLAASHVPAPWTLFINSTSPNRTIPPQGNVLIRVEGLPPKKTTKKAGKRRRKGDDDEEGDEEDEDGDEGEESAPEGDDYPEHKKLATRNAAAARKNFFNQTLPFQVKGKSGKVFYCRGVPECNIDNYDDNWEWPRAYVGEESQPITGAVWGVEGNCPFLVAIYSLSLKGDESCMYYILKGPFVDKEEAMHVMQLLDPNGGPSDVECVVPSDLSDAFSVSSGDDEVKRFYCPALECCVTPQMLCPSAQSSDLSR